MTTHATVRRMVLRAPRDLGVEATAPLPLGEHDVRVATIVSGISAGTELAQYRGTSPFLHRTWDAERRLFRPSDGATGPWPVRTLGYEEAGTVVEIGTGVGSVAVGDRVYGTWGHATHAVVHQDMVAPRVLPEGADPRIGIFSHIGAVALNGVHDARIRVGDVAVVFGLGVPGQIVAQLARAAGADVIGVDPDPDRRRIAEQLGQALTLDPTGCDVAEVLRDRTGGRGADVCIEVSGALAALATAIRTVAYASRVVAMGFYQGSDVAALSLGEEFHHNRVELFSSQISGVAPDGSHRWSKLRLWQTAVRLQHEGRLRLIPLITHQVPFDDAPTMFERLDAGERGIMQSVLTFGTEP